MTANKTLVESILKTEEAKAFFESQQRVAEKTTITNTTRQKAKLQKLRDERNREFLNNNKHPDWFVNNTKTTFPTNVQTLLSKGPKFALPTTPKTFPLFKYIADGEELVQTLKNKDAQESARTQLSLLLKDSKTKNTTSTMDRAILDTVGQTRQFLRKNNNILILTSDKGNKTVAMEKDDYRRKMTTILGDMCTYRIIKQDPTLRLQKKNNDLVEKLFKLEIISRTERNKLVNNTALPPRIYGLPKIHKENMPLRPICSSIGSWKSSWTTQWKN